MVNRLVLKSSNASEAFTSLVENAELINKVEIEKFPVVNGDCGIYNPEISSTLYCSDAFSE